MFFDYYSKIDAETSPERAISYIREVSRFHRIQVSEGFRESAHYVHDTCTEFGLDSEIFTYPADGQSTIWGQPPVQREWKMENAILELISPKKHAGKLADYSENKLSVIQRCGPTPEGGITAEIVAVDKADQQKSYEDIDVDGKFVLVDSAPGRVYQLAVVERGAAGIITDQMPTFPPVRRTMDLPDALAYRSFWFGSEEQPCPGFVLSPREGARTRKLLEQADHPVKVHAEVQAEFFDGTMEVVSVKIPGTTSEEVLITAHLCHPQPSANDNASGVSAAMEAARTLKTSIEQENLPSPRRTIRFLFIPEMAGTYAFLAQHEDNLDDFVAGINLDMVGARQDISGGAFTAEQPPRATPNFAGDLAALILQHAGGDNTNYAKTAKYASFRHAVTPFSGGSDHYILSDPTVGIPSPMLIQWPDKFYHTSMDTQDKIDPEMLARVASITATYAYSTAQADSREASWLASEMTWRFSDILKNQRSRMWEYLQSEGMDAVKEYVEFLTDRRLKDIQSLNRLGLDENSISEWMDEIKALSSSYLSSLQRLKASDAVPAGQKSDNDSNEDNCCCGCDEVESDQQLSKIVPLRTHPGPVSLRRRLKELSDEQQKEWRKIQKNDQVRSIAFTLSLYWADGNRSLAEIRDLVRWECGIDTTPYLVTFFENLAEFDLVEINND